GSDLPCRKPGSQTLFGNPHTGNSVSRAQEPAAKQSFWERVPKRSLGTRTTAVAFRQSRSDLFECRGTDAFLLEFLGHKPREVFFSWRNRRHSSHRQVRTETSQLSWTSTTPGRGHGRCGPAVSAAGARSARR